MKEQKVFRRSIKFETRTEEKQAGQKKLVLRGYPILFNTETTVYDFWCGECKEIILPTALDNTDLTNVYLLTGHNPDNLLGRSGVNLRLEVDEIGLFFECELPNTQLAKDIYTLVESGILDGMSFGFYCSDEVNPETRTRTITQIDELFEITITPFPAYKEATVISQPASESKGRTDENQNENNQGEENPSQDGSENNESDHEKNIKELEELLNE